MIAPQAIRQSQPRQVERARDASRRRVRRAQRRGYAGFVRVAAALVAVVGPVMLYVMLTANVTSLNYALARAETQKTRLVEDSARLDDRIAKLDSRERLAVIAAKLKMHDPNTYAVVEMPDLTAKRAPQGIAFLGAVTDWLKTP